MAYTTTELLAKVKLWAAIPDGQPAFTDLQLLDLMTDELRSNIAPFIVQFREDFFVDYADYTIVSTQSSYNVPRRAISTVLKDVKYVDTQGNETNVPRIPVGDSHYYSNGFYMKGNAVELLHPENRTGMSLRLYYYSRPATLVTVDSCSQILSFDATTITATSVPSGWATEGLVLDTTEQVSPFTLLDKDSAMLRASSVFWPTVMPDNISIGDYMSQATESCIAQIPLEVIPMLVQATVMRVNELLSDRDGLKISTEKYERMKKDVMGILSPRITEEVKTIVSRNSFFDNNYEGVIY